ETARHHLKMLNRKEMNTAASLKNQQTAGLSSHQVVAYHLYLKRLGERMTRQKALIGEIKVQDSEIQDQLLEAMKKRQILEKLKDRGLERYQQMVLKKEMAFIDEVAVNQFARKAIEMNGEGQ
ncbi:MAG: flagellar export protein FliJ, partial [Desulfosarcina sp.]